MRIFLGRDAETGKRSYRNHTVHGTKKDAQRYLTATLRDRDLGTFAEPSSDPLGQFLDRWLETAAKPKLKTKTFRDYQNILTRYVRPSLAKRPLVDVTPLDLQAIYKDIQVRGLSARTVRYTHAVVRSALQQAVKWRMLTSNPADAVELPKQSRKEVQVLSAEQTRAFLKAANKDRLGALFSLAVTAGLRPSEYLALKWPDLNLGAGTIRVVRSLDWFHGGGWEFAETKRPRSRRTIKLQTHVISALRAHRTTQDKLRCDAANRWTENDLIFTTRTGGPLDERNVAQQDFVRVLKAANLPTNFRLYDLRHTAATLALEAGVQPKVVSEMLGHASAAFTLDVYSHVLPHMQESA
ncbi:MAG: tyrosine-type recombinase/integrase, partial [Acidobacteriota bacterium]